MFASESRERWGNTSVLGANEQPGKEVFLLGKNYVWCLIIVAMRLGGAKSWRGYLMSFGGRGVSQSIRVYQFLWEELTPLETIKGVFRM